MWASSRTLTWVRGLKLHLAFRTIDIVDCRTLTWVRGLKPAAGWDTVSFCGRTLTWVRGLKRFTASKEKGGQLSHPYMGAWIETF